MSDTMGDPLQRYLASKRELDETVAQLEGQLDPFFLVAFQRALNFGLGSFFLWDRIVMHGSCRQTSFPTSGRDTDCNMVGLGRLVCLFTVLLFSHRFPHTQIQITAAV